MDYFFHHIICFNSRQNKIIKTKQNNVFNTTFIILFDVTDRNGKYDVNVYITHNCVNNPQTIDRFDNKMHCKKQNDESERKKLYLKICEINNTLQIQRNDTCYEQVAFWFRVCVFACQLFSIVLFSIICLFLVYSFIFPSFPAFVHMKPNVIKSISVRFVCQVYFHSRKKHSTLPTCYCSHSIIHTSVSKHSRQSFIYHFHIHFNK